MGKGVEFVTSYFKTSGQAIEELAAQCEAFRDLCDDFAIANEEKNRWRRSTSSDRQQRIAEYQELIDSILIDIERELERFGKGPFAKPS
ncbi:hypothetical protein PWG15_33910 (plasmid) [Ensifer adhaerens]|uniref:hypothetical protein n=1 Tax=Ensifer adhaerens TaxID=106592 RepID=UPI0023AA17B5|nr:hypothetical protein [Ensifer adhaerens]WDZ81897.1 hypothetical protein PWG15_33910 [Ensifer adhaerens]